MLIQYHECFGIVAEFHPSDGRLEIMQRPSNLSTSKTEGWFSVLGGVCVVFFRQNSILHLQVGECVFDLDAGATVEWRQEDEKSVFSVTGDGQAVVLRYRPGPFSGPALMDDPTPFVEPEDWDFGLFISNVVNDEERAHLVRSGTP